MRNQKGFSLVELLFVTALILIITAFAVPQFSKQSYFRLRTSAYNIANRLNEAKFRSIREITPYQITLDATAGSFSENRKISGTWNNIVTEKLKTNVYFVTGTTPYTFPSGAPSADGAKQCGAISGTCNPTLSTTISFNTNGLPVDASGAPDPSNAVYLSNGKEYFAITVSLAGAVEVWYYNNSSNSWLRP
jgi:prepilin-type N-terminal cleavage/methylation domain-containing protein